MATPESDQVRLVLKTELRIKRMDKADTRAHDVRILRRAIIRLGVKNGWWRTTSETTERLAARTFPRTTKQASELTDLAVARRVFDSAAPGVRHHLFSLPPFAESTIADPSSVDGIDSKTIQDLAGAVSSIKERNPVGLHLAGSLEDLMSGHLTAKIASTFAAWQPGQPIPIPYFTSDNE
jgi:hypothetical protein